MEGYFSDLKKIFIKKQKEKKKSQQVKILTREGGRSGGLRKDIGEYMMI